MVLYRILALLRKDFIWASTNKKQLMYASSFFVALFFVFFGINYLSSILEVTAKERAYIVVKFKLFFLYLGVMQVSLSWPSYLIENEKIKGTLLSLLTTPLKGYEFVLAKVIFSFSLIFFSSFMLILIDTILIDTIFIYLISKTTYTVTHFSSLPFVLLNLALFSGLFCLIGIFIGLFTKTSLACKKIIGLLATFLITISYTSVTIPTITFFDPAFHFFQVFLAKDLSILLIHTAFNALYFFAFLVFNYFYIRFYFSNNREKTFSLNLCFGLAGVISLFVLSGFISPHFVKRKHLENAALLELKEQIRINQSVYSANTRNIPIEDFFKKSEISTVKLSPNGEYLAYLKPFQNRMNIYVRKVDDINSEKQITKQTRRDIAHFAWKENDQLIFMKDFEGDENYRIFSVSAKGEDKKNLTPFKGVSFGIVDSLDGLSENHILISSNQRLKTVFDVYRLNIKTGNRELIFENPGSFTSYLTDHEGKLRVALSTDGVNSSVYYRETEKEEFKKIFTTSFKDVFTPVLFTFDNKNLFILSNIKRDKKAIQTFDPREKKILSTLFYRPEVDVSGLSYSKKRKVLAAVFYTTWKQERHFFDSIFQSIFEDLKSKFPKKEILSVSMNREEDLLVVFVGSDRNPGSYYLYHVKNKKLEKIADTRPWIKEKDLVEEQAIQYTSRDGLTINGYLSLPKVKKRKKLPVVVNPHGGPGSRDIWGYSPEVQFLASRGYAVFQMNFRGSVGYGKSFWMAGFKQWGQKMQDDITDGVQYLIDTGVADKDRIAIYGGSYGGYAVLAGLAFTPDLYACGINYVGISNLFTFLETIPSSWEPFRKQMYEKIGHPEEDKELLKKVSPFFHVDKIKAPLFVVHGANDPRVKKAEADQIVTKLESKGVKVPYLVKSNEGHGFRNEENQIEFYRLMEVFLENCLK